VLSGCFSSVCAYWFRLRQIFTFALCSWRQSSEAWVCECVFRCILLPRYLVQHKAPSQCQCAVMTLFCAPTADVTGWVVLGGRGLRLGHMQRFYSRNTTNFSVFITRPRLLSATKYMPFGKPPVSIRCKAAYGGTA
jgi:hypothetical protein